MKTDPSVHSMIFGFKTKHLCCFGEIISSAILSSDDSFSIGNFLIGLGKKSTDVFTTCKLVKGHVALLHAV